MYSIAANVAEGIKKKTENNPILKNMHLTDIIIYPVKSLGGIHLSESLVQREGLQYDRRWLLLGADGKFITQRTVPEMALVRPHISDGYLSFTHTEKNYGEIKIEVGENDGPAMPVQVWSDEVAARPVSKKVDEWFSEVFGFRCELVRIEENAMRHNLKGKGGKFVSFADKQPFLIIGEKSLEDLNSRMESPVPMNRFRPNFVFAGGAPYSEDTWGEYNIGDILLENTKPCDRCMLTTIDQKKGEKTGGEPLHTLNTYRKNGNNVDFGMRAKVVEGQPDVIVKVGDEIMVGNFRI